MSAVTNVDLVDVPAHQALAMLAAAAGEDLGTGMHDEETREFDGELEGPVSVTTTGVLGKHGVATTMAGGTATVTILVDEDFSSLMQLRKVIDELLAHCCTTSTVR